MPLAKLPKAGRKQRLEGHALEEKPRNSCSPALPRAPLGNISQQWQAASELPALERQVVAAGLQMLSPLPPPGNAGSRAWGLMRSQGGAHALAELSSWGPGLGSSVCLDQAGAGRLPSTSMPMVPALDASSRENNPICPGPGAR